MNDVLDAVRHLEAPATLGLKKMGYHSLGNPGDLNQSRMVGLQMVKALHF